MEFQPSTNINLAYCRASPGKRLANYFIDLILFYVILFFLGFAIEILIPGSVSSLNMNGLLDRLLTLVLYAIVMFLIEASFQGKSLGKVITGTRAVQADGSTLSFKTAFTRNIIRAIPFNALSGLGSVCAPWHDTLSHTFVVDEKLVSLEERKDEFFIDLKNQMQ